MSAESAAQPKRKVSIVEGRRELKDIIATARTMEERRLNPFHVDVGDALETADRYFESWEHIEDVTLDALALNPLSRVVKMQEGRLRYQAQLFHADPEAMAEKLTKFNTNQLAKVFLQAFHPVVEFEQLTVPALEEAMAYWNALEPIALRHRERPRRAPPPVETLSLDDLMAKGIVPRDTFGTRISAMVTELKESGATDYWKFIHNEDASERVRRAYAVSYLVTYGYAVLAQDKGGKLVLQPRSAREPPTESVSFPIVVTG